MSLVACIKRFNKGGKMQPLYRLGRGLSMATVLSGLLFGCIAGVRDNRGDSGETQFNPDRIYSSV